jgi:hypothetical protein
LFVTNLEGWDQLDDSMDSNCEMYVEVRADLSVMYSSSLCLAYKRSLPSFRISITTRWRAYFYPETLDSGISFLTYRIVKTTTGSVHWECHQELDLENFGSVIEIRSLEPYIDYFLP